MELVVGRLVRAHGLSGEVAVDVRTDAVDERFASGTRLATDPVDRGPLTVEETRWHAGRLLVRFAEVVDRSAAEALRGTLLVADSATSPDGSVDQWWDHELIGLRAETSDGAVIGEVFEVAHPPGQDMLVVRRSEGGECFIPFVSAIVTDVDLAAGRLVVNPPDGLLAL